MKVQIAIVTKQMITGGVEKSLVSLLRYFDYRNVAVDLYVEKEGGEFFEDIPKSVTIYVLQTVNVANAICHPVAAIRKLAALIQMRKAENFIEQCYLSSKMLLPIKKKYDIAISYHAPNTISVFYVIDKIKAKKKILWLHGDMESNNGSTWIAQRYYRQYNQVFAVSKNVFDSFLRCYPEMKSVTSLFYNFVDAKGIIKAAQFGQSFSDTKKFNILTVGRLDRQKGIDIAIKVCQRLIAENFDVVWYVCGEGSQRVELEKMIRDCGLQKRFILLGNQRNPYRYMKECNLYVQPSRYEGYCTTTNEARWLNKAVITTDVSGAREQFEDGVTGWIVPVDDREAMYQKIKWCLEHKEEIMKIEENLKNFDFNMEEDIAKIFK